MLFKTLALSLLASVALTSHVQGGLHRRIMPHPSIAKSANHQDKHSLVSSLASPVPSVAGMSSLSKHKGGKNATHFPGGRPARHANGTHSGHRHKHSGYRHKNGTSGDMITTTFTTHTITLTRTVTSTNNVETQEGLAGSGGEPTTTMTVPAVETAVAPESDDSEAPPAADAEEPEGEACVAPVYVTVTHKETLTQTSTAASEVETQAPVNPVKAPEDGKPSVYPTKPSGIPFPFPGFQKPGNASASHKKPKFHGHHHNGTHSGHGGKRGHHKKISSHSALPSSTPVSAVLAPVTSSSISSYAAPSVPASTSSPTSSITSAPVSASLAAVSSSSSSSASTESDSVVIVYSVVPVQPVPASQSAAPARK